MTWIGAWSSSPLTMALHMLVAVVSTEEHLLTKGALECPMVLACVGLVVAVQVLFAGERLAALRTRVGLLSRVGHLVAT